MEVLMLAAETGKPIGELMAMKVEDMLKFQAKFTVNPLQRKTQPELKLSQSDLAMSAWKHEPDHAARLRLKKDGFGCPRTRKVNECYSLCECISIAVACISIVMACISIYIRNILR